MMITRRKLIAAFAIAAAVAACSAPAPTEARHILVHIIGDSIAYAGPGNNLAPGFRCALYTQLVSDGVDFDFTAGHNFGDCPGYASGLHGDVVDGWPGYKIHDLIGIVDPGPPSAWPYLSPAPDLEVIMAGTNDLLGGDATYTFVSHNAPDMVALVVGQHLQYPNASFIIAKIPAVNEAVCVPAVFCGVGANTRAAAWNAAIPGVVDLLRSMWMDVTLIDPNVTVADVSPADGIHPYDNTGTGGGNGWLKIQTAEATAIEAYAARTAPARPRPQ